MRGRLKPAGLAAARTKEITEDAEKTRDPPSGSPGMLSCGGRGPDTEATACNIADSNSG